VGLVPWVTLISLQILAAPPAAAPADACDPAAKRAVEQVTQMNQALKAPSDPRCTQTPEFPPVIPKTSSLRLSSFRNQILQGNENMRAGMGPQCFDFLKKIYESGRTLSSETVRKAARFLSETPFASGVQEYDFFHYTRRREALDQFHPEMQDRAQAHALAMKEGAYEKMMQFLREQRGDSRRAYSTWGRVLYVAEDPWSSKQYGSLRIKFHFSPATLVIDGPRVLMGALTELNGRFPGLLAACPAIESSGYYGRLSEAFFPIVEESDIPLVHYGDPEHSGKRKGGWYQLLSPEPIRGTEVCYGDCLR
jgi:hypothetical protein